MTDVLTETPVAKVEPPQSTANIARMWRWLWTGVQIALMVLIVSWAVNAGVRLRRATWDFTSPVRFQSDIERNLFWGTEAADTGYLNLYERQRDQLPGVTAQIWLDYAPLRLALMEYWGTWAKEHYHTSVWQPTWDFNRPVVYANMAIEGLSALAMFLLVRLWVIRHRFPDFKHDPFRYLTARFWWDAFSRLRSWVRRLRHAAPEPASVGSAKAGVGAAGLDTPAPAMPRPAPMFGSWRALAAVLLAWFSPGVLMSAYGWPTYDSWVIPAYLWAILMASTGRWFLAGIAIGVGAMAKGQLLAVAPVFILWPLMLLKPGAALRWLVGAVTAVAAIASPWMFTYPPGGNLDIPRVTDWSAIHWVEAVVAAALVLTVLGWTLHLLRWRWLAWGIGIAATVPAIVAVLWPLTHSPAMQHIHIHRAFWVMLLMVGLLLLTVTIWLLPVRGRAFCRPALWGGAVLLCAFLARGRLAWEEWSLFVLLLAVLAAWVLPARSRQYTIPAAFGAATLLCVLFYHGSICWAECGWLYGTKHWPVWTMVNASNIPGVLESILRVRTIMSPAFTIPDYGPFVWLGVSGYVVTWKLLCNSVFAIALVVSAAAMARAAHRRSGWFLAAQAAPWLVFFLFPVQIHERYLLFGAGVAFAATGASLGMGLLAYMLSIITMLMTFSTAGSMGEPERVGHLIDPTFGRKLFEVASSGYPHMAWAVLAIAGVFFWSGFRASRGALRLAPAGRPATVFSEWWDRTRAWFNRTFADAPPAKPPL